MSTVGRDAELAVLARAVAETQDGRGRLTLLRGEAGIGKSWLAEQTVALARERGFTVLRGQAHALHAGLAYAPIVAAIRPYVAAGDDHTGLANLSRLLADPRLPAAPPGGDPSLARTRMFEAVVGLVTRLAPALLVVDDLHWADRGTVELVQYIGQGVAGQAVLVLGAYRPGDASTPLDTLATAVRRQDGEIDLAPLPDHAVAELTGNLLGSTPDQDFLDDVTRRAKGVPLFVTALVHTGFRADAPLPAIVRDVVLDRLQRLDERERRMMATVAVAGDAATDSVLRDIDDDPEALGSLVRGGLITELPADQHIGYRVSHPLYAEVTYADLTANERRQLHAAVLVAVEKTSLDDVLTLAPHYQEAGTLADPSRAVEITADAGWRALAMGAADEAVRYLSTAKELADPVRVPALLDGVGRAHQSQGRYEQAAAAWREGLALAARNGMLDDAGGLQLRLLRLEAESSDSQTANDRLHDLARRMSVTSHEAAFRHFEFTLRHSDEAEARAVTATMAGFIGPEQPPEARAVGYLGRGFQLLLERRHYDALPELESAVEHARQFADQYPFYPRFARLILSYARALTGDVRGCFAGITESIATPTLVEIPSLRGFELYGLAFATYLTGDIATALTQVDLAVSTAVDGRIPRSIGRNKGLRAFLLAELGRLADAKTALAEAKQSYLAPEMSLATIVALAEAAIGYYLDGPTSPKPFDPSSAFADPLSGTVRGLFTGLTALRNGDDDVVARMTTFMRDESPALGLACAFADRLDGLRTKDPDALAAAAQRMDEIGAPLFAAQARLEQAELVADRALLLDCLATFDRAGAAAWADRARLLARTLGIRIRPPRTEGVLSARETQVVRLLGEGLSNADIAARLFLSERTVETHLRNSYAKLGVTSRISLAQWASENLS
ncbi:ATP-binding protein [Actinocrispum wychmicini]|uniref:Regulatory LuxR family protein n=1 Tax=Actinocrispum wychmicini TaxID=1213861 RepID=A0A4R2IJ35_9PSEU|nr:LuxR family transcriptional regulator [Actinocrispum wychmicini]TCO44236.1 regulatory LuxR family protein [Actinocrispum wychmicini]